MMFFVIISRNFVFLIFRATTAIALNNPEVLSLGAGLPNPSLFPFQSAQFTINDGMQLSLQDEEIKEALQYTNSKG